MPTQAATWLLGIGCSLSLQSTPATAAEPPPDPVRDCAPLAHASARLACYDRVHRPPVSQPSAVVAPASEPVPASSPIEAPGGSGLSAVWELNAADDRGTFRMVPHRANYLLPFRWADRPNRRPGSPTADHTVTEDLPLDSSEAKFQFSFKFKAFKNLLGDTGDLWLAYTQQSHWQVYNDAASSPFRETNYEPEVILSLRTGADLWGWRWRHLNIGLVHQSNGRPLPLSRSWNRVYAQFGLERGNFSLLARPWIRLPEKDASDDNPDVRSFLGSTDVRLAYVNRGHVLSGLARYSFSGRRGALQFDWAFPITGALKGYVQATTGYGESMIDYNHAQNTFGIGVLLLPWQ